MTTHFPDVSHYQAGLKLDGAPAVIAKATQGTGFVDSSYLDFKAQAGRLGIPFCAYHWVDGAALADQALHARRIAGTTPMMWDAEAAGATVARLVELTTRYRSLGGVVHLVYLPHWWWAGQLGSPDLRPLAAAGLHLVSSDYSTGGYADSGPGWMPYGGITPVQWQYTSAKVFNGLPVDFNAYNGFAAEWAALIAGGIMAITQADAQLVASTTLGTKLGSSGPTVGIALQDTYRAVGRLELAVTALSAAVAALAAGQGNTDVTAILAGVQAEVDALRSAVGTDTRDAVADLGEGGAAQVRQG